MNARGLRFGRLLLLPWRPQGAMGSGVAGTQLLSLHAWHAPPHAGCSTDSHGQCVMPVLLLPYRWALELRQPEPSCPPPVSVYTCSW